MVFGNKEDLAIVCSPVTMGTHRLPRLPRRGLRQPGVLKSTPLCLVYILLVLPATVNVDGELRLVSSWCHG